MSLPQERAARDEALAKGEICANSESRISRSAFGNRLSVSTY
jgi:hypothetical protein